MTIAPCNGKYPALLQGNDGLGGARIPEVAGAGGECIHTHNA